jgi:hypothetical protein
MPLFLRQLQHASWTISSVLRSSSVDLPNARAFTLSTKPVPDAAMVRELHVSMS